MIHLTWITSYRIIRLQHFRAYGNAKCKNLLDYSDIPHLYDPLNTLKTLQARLKLYDTSFLPGDRAHSLF